MENMIQIKNVHKKLIEKYGDLVGMLIIAQGNFNVLPSNVYFTDGKQKTVDNQYEVIEVIDFSYIIIEEKEGDSTRYKVVLKKPDFETAKNVLDQIIEFNSMENIKEEIDHVQIQIDVELSNLQQAIEAKDQIRITECKERLTKLHQQAVQLEIF